MRRMVRTVGALLALVAACGSDGPDYQAIAVEQIEGAEATALGSGALDATCDAPESTKVGTGFACSATTASGDEILFRAEIANDEQVQLEPTNLLDAERLSEIESEAARILTDQVGFQVPAENLDCGDKPVVAVTGEPLTCGVTDPTSGETYDASITIEDLSSPPQLVVEVGDTPRP